MQLSTKVRYAVRAMLELAMNYEQGPMQVKEIARKQDIPEKYLEQIMLPLRTNGFVYARKGSRGGYYLNRDPGQITLLDIVESIEGSLAPVACVDNPESCPRVDQCVARNVWSKLGNAVREELQSVTLDDLAADQQEINNARSEESYHI